MRKILLAAVALTLIAAAPAWAGEKKDEKADKKTDQYVDITPVALPIVADGRLINYVFVQVRVNLTPGADATKLREKEPYLRDALVRAAHRTPFTASTDYFHADEAKLTNAVWRDSRALLGPANVLSIKIVSQQAKQRTGIPSPPGT